VTLDLARPEHREALAWACANWNDLDCERDAIKRSVYCDINLTGEQCFAIRALSSPSASAAIVRALLEGCGVALEVTTDRFFVQDTADGPFREVWWIDVYEGSREVAEIESGHIPALILALLACTDRDGAIAALKVAGR
jgi:hypothetical protein